MRQLSHIPSNVTETAISLCGTLFCYLLLTGTRSLGIGEVIPAVVSQVLIAGLLLIAFGTAVVTAYFGGRVSSSLVAPLAVAVGLSLFLVADSVFRLGATVSDLPGQFTVVMYLIIGVVSGLVAFLLGASLRWGSEQVPPSA